MITNISQVMLIQKLL